MNAIVDKKTVKKDQAVSVRVMEHGADLILEATTDSQYIHGRRLVWFVGAKAMWSPPMRRWVLVEWTRSNPEMFETPVTLEQALAGAVL